MDNKAKPFHVGRFAPDKFGGIGKFQKWCQVVRFVGSDETVVIDFLPTLQIARAIAIDRNCKL